MSKNKTGSLLMRTIQKEDRLLDKIDNRTAKGKNMENVDPVWQKHTINDKGERTWSF